MSHDYIISSQNTTTGEFDVLAKFQEEEPLTDEKLKVVIREVLRNGTITRDKDGKHHFIEGGKAHG